MRMTMVYVYVNYALYIHIAHHSLIVLQVGLVGNGKIMREKSLKLFLQLKVVCTITIPLMYSKIMLRRDAQLRGPLDSARNYYINHR